MYNNHSEHYIILKVSNIYIILIRFKILFITYFLSFEDNLIFIINSHLHKILNIDTPTN